MMSSSQYISPMQPHSQQVMQHPSMGGQPNMQQQQSMQTQQSSLPPNINQPATIHQQVPNSQLLVSPHQQQYDNTQPIQQHITSQQLPPQQLTPQMSQQQP